MGRSGRHIRRRKRRIIEKQRGEGIEQGDGKGGRRGCRSNSLSDVFLSPASYFAVYYTKKCELMQLCVFQSHIHTSRR